MASRSAVLLTGWLTNQEIWLLMKYYDCVSQYVLNRFLEPFMRSVRQCLMTRTDTILDQD